MIARRGAPFIARDPKVAFEVLSPSTRAFDALEKLEEYKGVAATAHIVIIDPARIDVALCSRAADGWAYERFTDDEAALPLAALRTELPLAEACEDVAFD